MPGIHMGAVLMLMSEFLRVSLKPDRIVLGLLKTPGSLPFVSHTFLGQDVMFVLVYGTAHHLNCVLEGTT